MSKIYTKTGDKGTTSLFTGERVDKDSLRVETYGLIDEITSTLGIARAFCEKQEVKDVIYSLQKLLMSVMAQVASKEEQKYIIAENVTQIESLIDKFNGQLPLLTHFIIPGDTKGAAALDLARTVTRRAERQALRLAKAEPVASEILILLNRLSDLWFILSRVEMEN